MMPRDDALKSEVECLGGRPDVLGVQNIFWYRIIIIVNQNPLMTECRNVVFFDSDTVTDRRKDR